MIATKAIVKLPRKSNRSLVVDTDYKPHQQEDVYLVTDKLYFDGLPSSVIENEIMDLVSSFDPIKIHLNRTTECCGYIQFVTKDMADRAYTLLNGSTCRAGFRLQLKINPPYGDYPEPEAHAGILHVKNLPNHIDNKSLYELFRPFGPMMLCKILLEQGTTFKGTALVQYFDSEHAHDAEHAMNNKQLQDNIITVFPFVSTKWRDAPNSPVPPSSPVKTDPSSVVDYTNLYIKNLDLNVKSADLFEQFRKFGRIISARVMKNAQTKQSKGFGFVSFSKADEAQKAKADMDGVYILSKPVIVAFHEPKKPRENGSASPTDTTHHPRTTSSPPIPSFASPLFVEQPYPQQRSRDLDYRYSSLPPQKYTYGQQHSSLQVQPHPHIQVQSHQALPHHPHPSHQPHQTTYSQPPQQQQHHHHQQQQTHVHHQTHHGQDYPVMSNKIYQPMERNTSRHSNNYDQRQQIPKHEHYTQGKREINGQGQASLSMLASGAFINTPPNYYAGQQQVRPTFRRRGSIESVASVMTETSPQTRRHSVTKAVLSIEKEHHKHVEDIVDMILTLKRKDLAACLFNKVILKAKIRQAKDALDIFQEQQKKEPVVVSRAIPIVAPKKEDLGEEIDKFLATLKGLALHEKKQLLGDRLFPLVKSTGVKQAPKITIRLLDSVPLDELAYSMYDKDKLKHQVSRIVSAISSRY